MTGWHWVDPQAILDYNDDEVGLGVRDESLVRSAMARPANLVAYASLLPDAADLAACYAAGIAQNHGFVDGNKRSAWVAARLFLRMNGFTLLYKDSDSRDREAARDLGPVDIHREQTRPLTR